MTRPLYYWHVHHNVLFEEIVGTVEGRVAYIKARKPREEVETRLRLLKPVRFDTAKLEEADAKREEAVAKWEEAYAKLEEAVAKLKEAVAKWEEAYAKRREAYAKRREAYAKLEEAVAKWREADAKREEAVVSDHDRQCPDCPWDGKTIFPMVEAKR